MPARIWLAIGLSCSILASPVVRAADPEKPAASKAPAAKEKGGKTARDAKADAEYYELYKIFADTMYQVEQNYVKDVNRRELMEAAIRGVLDKLDPYSNYFNPEETGRFKDSVDSQFGGIGIQITMEGGQLRVLSPIVGSPAYKAGLQAGDAILEIGGKPTKGITLDEAVRRLKGEAGTNVTLTVEHKADHKHQTVTIGREIIQLETVLGDRRKADDTWDFMLDHDKKIGYIRLTAFSRETADDLERALESLRKQQVRGLILDLRFNPGGLLKSATDVADLFVSEGVIVSTKGRNTAPRVVSARKPGTFEGFPMVVLVNHYSASASEIVAACLQDHHRAKILGDRTWGKGSVQNVIDLEDGRSALKLTTASYWRPNGHNIHKFPDAKETDEWGVMPDKGFELKLPDSELAQLVHYRRDRDIVAAKQPAAEKEDTPIAESIKDNGGGKSGEKKQTDAKDKTPPAIAAEKKQPAAKAKFVDRQLQKAVEYLDEQVASRGSR